MRRVVYLIIAMMLLAGFGCTKAGLKEEVVFELGRDHVFLVHETDKAGKVIPQGLDHPAALTTEQIDRLLEAIRYSEYSFFKWRGDKPVFIESERAKLTKHVSLALQAAGPDNWIKFAVTAKKRDLLLPTRRITDGYIFVKDKKLNIVLANLNFELSDSDDPYAGDPRNRYTLGALRFNEEDGMNHPPVDPTDSFLKRPHNNWLLIDIPKILKEAAPDPEAQPRIEQVKPVDEKIEKPEEKPEKSLEERLLELKELLDKGLITQEDFEKKKAELLEQL